MSTRELQLLPDLEVSNVFIVLDFGTWDTYDPYNLFRRLLLAWWLTARR